jgi:hypothetical protein
MNLKQLTVGAFAALSLGLTALPAHAYIFGYSQDAGANLQLNGGANALQTMPNPITGDVSTGWYSSTGYHDPTNDTYLVASATDPLFGGAAYNNFFVFDLSGLTADIVSGSILVRSTDVSRTDLFRLGSYSGDVGALEAGTGGTAAFHDLGAGTFYGSRVFHQGEQAWVWIDLNSDFATDINNAITNEQPYFVLGGTVGQLPPGIPEPAAWALMIVGFLGTGAALRARRRAALA